MEQLVRVVLLLALLMLPACASVTTGSRQNVAVTTTPDGAKCDLTNEKGAWQVLTTPGAVEVHRANGDLVVTCEHPDGSKAMQTVRSTTGGAVYGNILAGGIIGAAVDMSSGAAYDYPSAVNVALVAPKSPTLILSKITPEQAKVRLSDLQDMRRKKLISDQEYENKRKSIVDQM